MSRRCLGFTLVELLVVIAIIGILIALLLPAVQAARESARRAQCSNNLKQIGVALHTYHDARKEFPPGNIQENVPVTASMPFGRNWTASWGMIILPYIEQAAMHEQYDFTIDYRVITGPPNAVENARIKATPIKTYNCPSDNVAGQLMTPASQNASTGVWAASSYRSNGGLVDGAGAAHAGGGGNVNRWWSQIELPPTESMGYGRGPLHAYGPNNGNVLKPESTANILDGTGNTLAIGEYYTETTPTRTTFWAYAQVGDYHSSMLTVGIRTSPSMEGSPPQCQDRARLADFAKCNSLSTLHPPNYGSEPCKRAWGSNHPSVFNFALCDGSVRSVSKSISCPVFASLHSIAGGEVANTY
jgi:prepilin-type N-terminal cleavage/methylation domain-containing protein